MREIKFRAWDLETGGWATHNDFLGDSTSPIKVSASVNPPSILQFGRDDLIIQQFTGLKDRNGREIYEGDILSFPDTESEYVDVGIGNVKVAEFPLNAFFPIEFKEGEFGMTVEDTEHGIDGWISLRAFNEDYYKMSECEVIGNIYQDGHLLK
jgi:uncharacterized phage protein (TIGR01671 family)